jgi:hypothetical protein
MVMVLAFDTSPITRAIGLGVYGLGMVAWARALSRPVIGWQSSMLRDARSTLRAVWPLLDAIEAGDVQAGTAEGQQMAAAESSETRLSRLARLNQAAEQYEPLWKMAAALVIPIVLAVIAASVALVAK